MASDLAAQQNCLGLPQQVALSTVGADGEYRLDHRHSATGQKLWRQATGLSSPGGPSKAGRQSWTEYHGPLVYEWDDTPIRGGEDGNDPKGGGGPCPRGDCGGIGGGGGGGGGVTTFTPGPDNAPALPAFAGTEEGRVVNLPNLPLGHPDTYEYHYRDHLGNLRLAYRPRTPQGQSLRLTNEPENAAAEADNQRFSNFVPHRSNAHAHAGLHGLRATVASGRTGRTAQRVRLLAGQALAASAMALYEGTGGGSAQQRAGVAGRAADGGTAPPPSEVVGSGKTAAPALEMQKNGLTLASRIPDPSVPRARLVLRLFADASGGTVLHEQETYLDNTASWAWQQLSIGKLATADCWAEVYVENLSGVPVWFDDLEIQTGALPVAVVVQETHYDPWGLELAGIGYVADPAKEHKFTYNGKEKQDQFGLGWLDYGARHYQADIARWGGVDPLAFKYTPLSPFAYVANNPVNSIDPDGRRIILIPGLGHDPSAPSPYVKGLGAELALYTQKHNTCHDVVDGSFTRMGDMLHVMWNSQAPVRRAGEGSRIDNVARGIAANLLETPLGEDEQLNLMGLSQGSTTTAQAAILLLKDPQKYGLGKDFKIDNLVLGGSPVSTKSRLFKQLQRLEQAGKIGKIHYDDFQSKDRDGNYNDKLTGLAGSKLGGLVKGIGFFAKMLFSKKAREADPHVRASQDKVANPGNPGEEKFSRETIKRLEKNGIH